MEGASSVAEDAGEDLVDEEVEVVVVQQAVVAEAAAVPVGVVDQAAAVVAGEVPM